MAGSQGVMARILVVDDDPAVRFTLEQILCKEGHQVDAEESAERALARIEDADRVLTDLAMPGMDGLALLRHVRERRPELPVILLTAFGSEKVAVSAIKAGAYDYLAKPFDNDELRLTVARALEAVALKHDNLRLTAERALSRRFVAQSAVMRRLLESVRRIASKDVTVLVRGETGTGKEMIATLLHAQSRRAEGPLIRFNCAALPDELAEAELFGHVRGAFTGAQATRTGFFVRAHGGTLVLDEVGELSAAVQAKLLRAVQEGEVQPVGASAVQKVDVRIVASTNRDLAAEVAAGAFREDLYYRLAVVELVVPPLRERRDDIEPLARELARMYAERFELATAALPDALVERLTAMPWPGNVRQLENVIARLAALAEHDFSDADAGWLEASPSSPGSRSLPPAPSGLREELDAFERALLVRALELAQGNMSEAARQLGIGRATLFDKLQKFDLDPHGRPRAAG
jgi:DNA-binding NtrC family response regulator